MPGERRGVIESLATVRARVTLSLGVDSLVPGQGRGMIEALVTVVAHVGLVSLLVDPLLYGTAIGEGFPRLRRRIHRVLQVGLMVARERRGVIEALAALGAGVRFPSGMDLLVLLKMAFTDKALPALVAFVWLLARVNPLVLPQGGSSCKALSALCAPVGLVPHSCSMGFLVLLQV